MLKKITIYLCFTFLSISAYSQSKLYQIFTKDGQLIEEKAFYQTLNEKEIIFFGELHNNSVAHWLQLQILKNLNSNENEIILAGEFFERDDQLNINEWLEGRITDKNFEAEAKLWNNYATDYKPLMLFAKENKIPVVATNVPRKYASVVSREGLKSLESFSEEAKKSIAPLPIEVDMSLPGYKGMKEMMHGSSMNVDFMVEAQAIKDATMAFSLFEFIGKGKTILHVNGSYHSNNYEGIVWYLRKEFVDASVLTIATVEQNNTKALEENSKGIADFIIVLPTDSPKSY
ncbi:ChaN family lipoprotein [Belliella sp. DSM 107340]|uniref:ChaN family lipoprotein n=1 Tax=Belliella calami TaxID=2923436 RepID=A0ABS9UNM6_9BACT|nr:ChaN family lipoprotein [Belliella calami]MCH7398231.1 ChaN family lipoprotein [Belliella calami]